MKNGYKPGGGNKPQPYIPAGNGDKSGEYTNKPSNLAHKTHETKYYLSRNQAGKYNFRGSSLVKKVDQVYSVSDHVSISRTGKPNSVVKKINNGYVISERYYNEKGEAYLDIDYTCHGNPKAHPEVPHIHRWYKDENGHLKRSEKWESFIWKLNA